MPAIHVRPQVALWLQTPPRCDNRVESIPRSNYLYSYMVLTGIKYFSTKDRGIYVKGKENIEMRDDNPYKYLFSKVW